MSFLEIGGYFVYTNADLAAHSSLSAAKKVTHFRLYCQLRTFDGPHFFLISYRAFHDTQWEVAN